MKQRLLVISSYPPKGTVHDRTVVGVAPYTKKAVEALVDAAKRSGEELAVTVLAEKIKDSRFKIQEESISPNTSSWGAKRLQDLSEENNKRDSGQARMTKEYKEEGVTVKRIWDRGRLTTFLNLTKEVLREKQTKHVMIGFELSMFGGVSSLLFFPFFLLFIRLLRKDITIVLHHVITDIGEISGHLNMEKKSLKGVVLNWCLSVFYFSLLDLSTRVIVFEDVLKNRLSKFGVKEKITVIPLGVEAFHSNVSKEQARKLLGIKHGEFVLVAFGFFAWYKGTDWLVDAFAKLKEDIKQLRYKDSKSKNEKSLNISISQYPNIQLILAGGPNFQRLHFPFYKRYVAEIEKKCHEFGITVSGFIEEKEVPLYFQAADLLIFPYRTLMSSSGPLTISYSFHTPFLFSKPLAPILKTKDLHQALAAENIHPEDIIFSDKEDFIQKITACSEDATLLKKLSAASEQVAKKRSWKYIGENYYNVVFKE